jgi:hypothetical protein
MRASKRNRFRFRLRQRPLTYIANGVPGKGLLTDISVKGCAVGEISTAVSVDDRVTVVVERHEQEELPLEFQGRVVRAEGKEFAVEFIAIEDDRTVELLKFCAEAARADKDK